MRGQERRRIGIGHYPTVTLSEARKEAKRLLATTHLTGKRVTFAEAYETFKTDYIARRKERTQKDYKRMIEKHLPTLKSKRMPECPKCGTCHLTSQKMKTTNNSQPFGAVFLSSR